MIARDQRFTGYAALFGVTDAGGDTISRGAFAKTLTNRKIPIPLYWQHRLGHQIGTIEQAREDERGLAIIGLIYHSSRRSVSEHVNGLSFGYHARAFRKLPVGRALDEIELVEISLVTNPLQSDCRATVEEKS